jgi:glycerate dehydrogenase
MKIVFLDTETIGPVKALKELEKLGTLTTYAVTSTKERFIRIADNEVVITNKVIIDREVMDSCPAIKLVCVAATGINNVDLKYAAEKGIIVKNVAGYSTESVAQHTFSLLFYLLNMLADYDHYVKSGAYIKSPVFTHLGQNWRELNGKVFGIIGMGTIGKCVAEIARAFGARVNYFSTSGNNRNAGYEHKNLDELLKISDVVSIHCPLNELTKNLIGLDELKRMKPDAVLLNTGRGGIVDEYALAEAIDKDWIGGAGVDVFSQEPMNEDNPLLRIKNKDKLVLTPHIAWTSVEAREKLIDGVIKNIRETDV